VNRWWKGRGLDVGVCPEEGRGAALLTSRSRAPFGHPHPAPSSPPRELDGTPLYSREGPGVPSRPG